MQLDTAPSKTMEYSDIVHSNVVDVHSGSETVKTDNSLKHVKVENLNMVQNSSDTLETFDSVKTGNLIEHDMHCKLHVCRLKYLLCFFEGIHKRKK